MILVVKRGRVEHAVLGLRVALLYTYMILVLLLGTLYRILRRLVFFL